MFNWLPNKLPSTNPFYYAWNKLIDWCVRNTLQSSDDIAVNQTSSGTTLKILKKFPTGGDGGKTIVTTTSTWNYRGLWTGSPPSPYMVYDVVQMGSGTSSGIYLSTVDGNLTTPDSGVGWVQVSSSAGTWL